MVMAAGQVNMNEAKWWQNKAKRSAHLWTAIVTPDGMPLTLTRVDGFHIQSMAARHFRALRSAIEYRNFARQTKSI